jgi:EmrB/QacA subfamily drug resistance transporter
LTLVSSPERTAQRVALACAVLASFVTPFMSSSINIALPAIGSEFSMNAMLLGWVASAYLLAAAMALVPFGRIADLAGRKRIFAVGIGAHTVFSLACALAPTGAALILFRVLQGFGGAMMFATATAIVTSVFPPGQRGRALGITAAVTYLGLSLGPVLGGLLTQHLGWRSIFYVNLPFGAIAVLLLLWKLKGEWLGSRGKAFDSVGTLLYALSLPSLMYGLSRLPALTGVWFLAGGACGLALFILWELRAADPVLNVRLFRGNPVFAYSNLAALINYSATFAVTFLLSLYLQYIKALSPQAAGLVLVVQPALMAALSPIAGRLSDRVDPRLLATAGMLLAAAGLLLFAFLGSRTSMAFVAGGLAVLGVGFALFSSPNTNAIMSSVDGQYYGMASATLASMRLVGQMLSMGLALLVYTLFLGQVRITPQVYGGLLAATRTAFLVFAALCFGGVFASMARGRQR